MSYTGRWADTNDSLGSRVYGDEFYRLSRPYTDMLNDIKSRAEQAAVKASNVNDLENIRRAAIKDSKPYVDGLLKIFNSTAPEITVKIDKRLLLD